MGAKGEGVVCVWNKVGYVIRRSDIVNSLYRAPSINQQVNSGRAYVVPAQSHILHAAQADCQTVHTAILHHQVVDVSDASCPGLHVLYHAECHSAAVATVTAQRHFMLVPRAVVGYIYGV